MATGTHDACSESVDEMTTGPSDASSETVKQVTGSVVQLDREKCEGLIRPEDSVGRDLPFDRSVIALDERYLGEIIIGVQFCCDIVVDAAGTQKILKMTPAKMMVHEGIIKEIRRLEGVAEVSPNFLDTPVVFSRTHLDDPDSFQKLRIGDRVRVEMEFYNLISERKPPRASRVILLDDPNDQQCVRLRSALRRSNSLSGRPQNSDREDDIDQDFLPRPRSSSQGNRFVDDAWIDEYGPDFPVVPHDRRPRSLFEPPPPPPPTSFYPPHGFGAFPPISSPAAWMAQRSYIGMPFGPRSLPIGLPPNVHGVYRHQHFLQPGSMPGPYRCASSRFFQAPPFSYAPPNLLPESLSKHEPNARLNNTLPPSNPLTNAPPTSMDDSNVVLELTVDELRRLILEQPRVRSPDQHR